MDERRFDDLTRMLAGGVTRRGMLRGALAAGVGFALSRAAAEAACPPGQVRRRGSGCVCKLTARPPVDRRCPCPVGQSDTGDGQGCVECHADADCPADDACMTWTCVEGACSRSKTVCPDDADRCTAPICDPRTGCGVAPVVCSDSTPYCDSALGCVACRTAADCGVNNACTTYSCTDGVCAQTALLAEGAQCDVGRVCIDGACLGSGACTASNLFTRNCSSCGGSFCSVSRESGYVCLDPTARCINCASSAECGQGHVCLRSTCGAGGDGYHCAAVC